MASSIEGFRPYRGEGSYEPHRVQVKENKKEHSTDLRETELLLQTYFKRMSDYPDQPRVFSQAKIFIPACVVFLPICIVMLGADIAYYDPSDPNYDEASIILPAAVLLMYLVFLFHGLFFRIGVDEEKVWCRFWPFYYKEVRFDEVTRFETPMQRYKLFAGKKKIRLNYVRFDFSLVLIRLLVELDKRRFTLRKVGVDDPDFENEARIFRKIWANWVREDHWNYYVRFPDEMERIRVLGHLPAEWTEPIDADRRRRAEQGRS